MESKTVDKFPVLEEVTLSPIIIPIWLPAKVEVIDGFKGEPRESFQEVRYIELL